MSISVISITRIDNGTFQFTVSPSTYYDVWLRGRMIASHRASTETVYVYDGWDDDYEPPPLEFVDYEDTPDSYDYPPYGTLQWWGDTAVSYYSVQQYVGSAWVEKTQIPEDGQGYYQYETEAQDDGTVSMFRVVPYDSNDYDGAQLPFTITVVCYPLPPSIDVTYDPVDGELDIIERT